MLAGGIGASGVVAPGLGLHAPRASSAITVAADSHVHPASLTAYLLPAHGASLAGNQPSNSGRALAGTAANAPSLATKNPITFSLFAGYGGAITWDPTNGEVTIAFGVGRQFSLSMNDLPTSGTGAAKSADSSIFKGAGIQGELGGKIPQAWADAVGLPLLAGSQLTGKANGKWATDGTLTFRVFAQLRISPALVTKLPPELQVLFKDGSLSLGYQFKVDTHGSLDARQWSTVSAETGTIAGQSFSFGSPKQALTSGSQGLIANLGNSLFEMFKSGTRDFGGHVAGNFTVQLSPTVKDAINGVMQKAFDLYNKQLGQDTKSLQKSNQQLQKDLNNSANAPTSQQPTAQQRINSLEGQISKESGQLQTDTQQFEKNTLQNVQDILNKFNHQGQQPKNPAPGLPPAKQNGPARAPAAPAGRNPAGAPPKPGFTGPQGTQQGGSGTRQAPQFPGSGASRPGSLPQRPASRTPSRGTGTGTTKGQPGTASGPASIPSRLGTPLPGTGSKAQSKTAPQTKTPQTKSPQARTPQSKAAPQTKTPQTGTPQSRTPQNATPPQSSGQPQPGSGRGAALGGQGIQGTGAGVGGAQVIPASLPGGQAGPAGAAGGQLPQLGNLPGGPGFASSSGVPPQAGGTGGQTPQPDATGQSGALPGGQAPDQSGALPGGQAPDQSGAQAGGQTQGLPGTQSGAAVTPPGSTPAPSGGNPDVNPDGTLNTPPLDRSEPDPTLPPVIVPPLVSDAGDLTGSVPVITVSAPVTPTITPVPIPVADPVDPGVDSPGIGTIADPTVDTADDFGTPSDFSSPTDTGGGFAVADAGFGDSGDG